MTMLITQICSLDNGKVSYKVTMPYLVCLSAYDDQSYRDMASKAGINEYYLKPISIEQVRDILAASGIASL